MVCFLCSFFLVLPSPCMDSNCLIFFFSLRPTEAHSAVSPWLLLAPPPSASPPRAASVRSGGSTFLQGAPVLALRWRRGSPALRPSRLSRGLPGYWNALLRKGAALLSSWLSWWPRPRVP